MHETFGKKLDESRKKGSQPQAITRRAFTSKAEYPTPPRRRALPSGHGRECPAVIAPRHGGAGAFGAGIGWLCRVSRRRRRGPYVLGRIWCEGYRRAFSPELRPGASYTWLYLCYRMCSASTVARCAKAIFVRLACQDTKKTHPTLCARCGLENTGLGLTTQSPRLFGLRAKNTELGFHETRPPRP